ncbi:hypothetical protein [Deinococcus sp. RM]|uniref:hypothetical protein n=1 Tax=Deinococcus sp. RM TaxID=2316359 RepID=UPI0011C22634|nr:hypothetical protein [Deinococcus sp. RM]
MKNHCTVAVKADHVDVFPSYAMLPVAIEYEQPSQLSSREIEEHEVGPGDGIGVAPYERRDIATTSTAGVTRETDFEVAAGDTNGWHICTPGGSELKWPLLQSVCGSIRLRERTFSTSMPIRIYQYISAFPSKPVKKNAPQIFPMPGRKVLL